MVNTMGIGDQGQHPDDKRSLSAAPS